MAESLFSDQWYRVAELTPRLRPHASITRHRFRGGLWYVLEDKLSGKYHRFKPQAHFLMQLMDGNHTMQQLWQQAVSDLGEEAPTQKEAIQLLGQLHAADMLSSDALPDSWEMQSRHKKQERQKIKQRFLSPLSIRIPLVDPERFLNRWANFVSPVFGLWGAILWCALLGYALMLLSQNWQALSHNVVDTVLTPGNLFLLWLLFPAVKVLHELGHGFATRVWGGEVHEMGLMLLVFMPVPYVDASSASSFPQRYRRVIVAAAGMMVEVALASVALIIWVDAETGLLKTLAYNVMLIAGVSTLLFNLNPLLRFDGYYILSDLLEMPNLGVRSNRYLGYLIQKYLFGVKRAVSPVTASGERKWFVIYSISSFLYRAFIMVAIAVFIAAKYYFIGVLLAVFTFFNMFVMPLIKHAKFLLNSPVLHMNRKRALRVSVCLISLMVVGIGFYPWPHWSNAQGIVWLPEESRLRMDADCFVSELYVVSGETVTTGQTLMRCEEPELSSQIAHLEGRLKELSVLRLQDRETNLAAAEQQKLEMTSVNAELDRLTKKWQSLKLVSPGNGQLIFANSQDLKGTYVNKGQILAYIIKDQPLQIRAVVGQSTVAEIREKLVRVELRMASVPDKTIEAKVLRQVPGAGDKLPAAALGSSAGGDIAVDPRASDQITTFEKVFQFHLEPMEPFQQSVFGERVFIRFYHDSEPLIHQGWLKLRQLFLGEFGV